MKEGEADKWNQRNKSLLIKRNEVKGAKSASVPTALEESISKHSRATDALADER